jgi:hypothetical protein
MPHDLKVVWVTFGADTRKPTRRAHTRWRSNDELPAV